MTRLLTILLNWLAPEGYQDKLGFHFGKLPIILLFCAVNCFGADFWVAQNATGSGSGADTNDCMALGWPSANPGDTVHLCGTLTNALTIGGSGSAGNPITIHFEPNAMFSAPTTPGTSEAWIGFTTQNWLVIDGGQNGIIECTDNGTGAAYGGTMDFSYNPAGIWCSGNHVVIKNLTIRNLYQRQTNTEPIGAYGGLGNDIGFTGSDLVVSNCWLSEAQNGIIVFYGNGLQTNLTVTACVLSNYNHGITLGVGAVPTPLFDNVFITHNVFQGADMFETADGGPDLGFHRNPIFFFNESSDGLGCISNIIIANNFIKHGLHPLSSVAGSGAMFFDLGPMQTAGVKVYNNISTLASGLHWSGGSGPLCGTGNGALVANNTIVAPGDGSGGFTFGGTNAFAFNNISIDQGGSYAHAVRDTSTWGAYSSTNYAYFNVAVLAMGACDYNIYNGSFAYSGFNQRVDNLDGSVYHQLSEGWTDYSSWWSPWDAHSTTNAVQLDANFIPLSSDTVAIGNGTNLTAFAIADNIPDLTNDFAGNPRPATGNWTIGAYEFQAGTITPGSPGGSPWFW